LQSAIQTIASIEGDNKIVRTNIISGGQTFVLQPTDTVPQPVAASSVPVQPAINPSVPVVASTVLPAESSETMDADTMEVVGNILKPGLVPTSTTPHSHHEFNPESESGEASHTPTIESIMNSTPSDIIPSIIDVSEIRPGAEPIDSVISSPMSGEEKEPFGITSVIMGPVGHEFTTYITRFEAEDRTVVSTIAHDSTEVNYFSATTAAPTTPEQPIVVEIQEPSTSSTTESTTSQSTTTTTTTTTTERTTTTTPTTTTTNRPPSPTFPAESPFNPPTVPVVTARPPTARPTIAETAPTTRRPPVTPNVQENKSDNKVVLSGVLFGANQPSSVHEACNKCSKDKQEVCSNIAGQHKCICRPGYSRSDASQPCTRKLSLCYLPQVNISLIGSLCRFIRLPAETGAGTFQRIAASL
jgi:hypothetical protein